MKTKVRKFSHKLLALFMAVIMGLTCFTGVITASAASNDVKYNDDALEYNELAWRLMSDEQMATALLDALEPLLQNTVGPLVHNALSGISAIYTADTHKVNIPVLNIGFTLDLYSVDGLLNTLDELEDFCGKASSIGDVYKVHLDATKSGMSRSKNTSCEIITAILGDLKGLSFNSEKWNYTNWIGAAQRYDNASTDVLGSVLRGEFSVGGLAGFIGNFIDGINLKDIYRNLDGVLGFTDGFEDNLIFNLVRNLIVTLSGWFTAAEQQAYLNGSKEFVLEDVLLDKMNTMLLDKINVLVTYSDGTNSGSRKEAGTVADPNLRYSFENPNNVLLFVYGDEKLTLKPTDTLLDFGKRALDLAWKTVLKDTIKLIHVNSDYNLGHGENFDNAYFYWAREQFTWDTDNLAEMYSKANVEKWASEVYADYDAKSAEEFLGWVKDSYTFDRTAAEDSQGKWSDIDSTTLFNRVRYSPLADRYFDMQTGPLNLYISQTGTANLDKFFENNFNGYTSLVTVLNDALVAAVKDFFITGANVDNGATYTVTTTDNSDDLSSITSTLVANAINVLEFVANATDENILKAYYDNHPGEALTEKNLETAMLPFLISCLGNINLGHGRLDEVIHPADWDACQDAEAVAFIALREYLSYILADKDYDQLVNITETSIEAKTGTMFNNVILPMARDAFGYVLEGSVPLYDVNGNKWTAETSDITDSETTIFTILNSVLCYYADDLELANGGLTNGLGALIGLCDDNGRSTVNTSKTLWENVDAIINQILPVIGTLQYGVSGKSVNSEELIMNDIVNGMLEIGEARNDGLYGVSNFIYKLLTVVSADPISNEYIIDTVYNVLADLINGVFGNRYSTQNAKFNNPIPNIGEKRNGVTITREHPFNDLIQRDVIVGTKGDNISGLGVLQMLIINAAEAVGYNDRNLHAYPDSAIRGIMFVVQAINSFVPGFLPQIGSNTVKTPSAYFDKSVVGGLSDDLDNMAATGTLYFSNNMTGLNTAYIDENGDAVPQDRMTVAVKEASYYPAAEPDASVPIDAWAGTILQPDETLEAEYETLYDSTYGDSTVYELKVVYDVVYLNSGLPVSDNLTNLVATGTQVLTSSISWKDAVYPEGWSINDALRQRNNAEDSHGNTVYASAKFDDNLRVQYPQYIIASQSNLRDVENYQFGIDNEGSNDRYVSSVYAYDNGTVLDAVSGQNVTVNESNAKVMCDKDGNIISPTTYDYRIGDGAWVRNMQSIAINGASGSNAKINAGFSSTEINAIRMGLSAADANNFETRPATLFTIDEAKAAGIFQAATKDADGNYNAVYLKNNTSTKESVGGSDVYVYKYDSIFKYAASVCNVPGFYVQNTGFWSWSSGQDQPTFSFLKYDGSEVEPGVYTINNIAAYGDSTNRGGAVITTQAPLNIIVVDTTIVDELQAKCDRLKALIANFDVTDLADGTAYNAAINAVAAASETLQFTTDRAFSILSGDDSEYTAQIAAIDKATDDLEKDISPIIEENLYAISEARYSYNQNNFENQNYYKMMDIADAAGNKYQVVINYTDENGETKDATLYYTDYAWSYRDNENITINSVKFITDMSMAEITACVNDFKFYESLMIERGYKGAQLEKEIECASGNDFYSYTVTQAKNTEDGIAIVESKTATAKFGTFVNGVLTNADKDGKKIYTDKSWTAYVNALADAVYIAQLGNGDYAHKDSAKFDPAAKDYFAQVSAVYAADTALQRAEIALTAVGDEEEPPVGDTYNVSASLVVASNVKGDASSVAVNGNYTVTIYNADKEAVATETFAMSKGNNTFSFDLAAGTYTATIESAYSLTRNDITITVGNADVTGSAIPIIACDFNGDGNITGIDAGVVYAQAAGAQEAYCDLNGDGTITGVDAGIVYACVGANAASLTPVTIA